MTENWHHAISRLQVQAKLFQKLHVKVVHINKKTFTKASAILTGSYAQNSIFKFHNTLPYKNPKQSQLSLTYCVLQLVWKVKTHKTQDILLGLNSKYYQTLANK